MKYIYYKGSSEFGNITFYIKLNIYDNNANIEADVIMLKGSNEPQSVAAVITAFEFENGQLTYARGQIKDNVDRIYPFNAADLELSNYNEFLSIITGVPIYDLL